MVTGPAIKKAQVIDAKTIQVYTQAYSRTGSLPVPSHYHFFVLNILNLN